MNGSEFIVRDGKMGSCECGCGGGGVWSGRTFHVEGIGCRTKGNTGMHEDSTEGGVKGLVKSEYL